MNTILTALASKRWLITEDGMRQILGHLPDRLPDAMVGDLFSFRLEAAETAAAIRAAKPARSGAVGIVSIRGPIVRHESWFTMLFGGTSVEWLMATVRELAADESVASILLDVDSPGGTISGLPEAAAVLRAAREVKPVLAITNDLNCSAAYWLSSQADEMMSTPEGLTGSVGVYTEHFDLSQLYADAGISHEYIQAGKFKTEGNEFEPLGDDARAHIQGIVDDGYGLFLADVAKGRGITAQAVKSSYGEGRVMVARDAKTAGLIDRIGTLSDAYNRAGSGKVTRRAVADPSRQAGATAAGAIRDKDLNITVAFTAASAVGPESDDEPVDTFAFERERRQRGLVTSSKSSAGAFVAPGRKAVS
jgi:signal peptide peptidase SppA